MADKGKESRPIGAVEEEEEEEGEYESSETVERDVEAEEAQGESGDDVVIEGCDISTSDETTKNRSFIAELNLIMITAFLTLSNDELSQLDESEKLACAAGKERRVAKAAEKVQQSRRLPRECCGNSGAGGFKFADRRSVSRSQSSSYIGSRHGRKT